MMENKTNKRKRNSSEIRELLQETTPQEKLQISTKMAIAARLEDLLEAKGWNKGQFAEQVGKNPSEITKWLSGTHNFTIDTLAEIAVVMNMSVSELFAPKRVQTVNKTTFVLTSRREHRSEWCWGLTPPCDTGVAWRETAIPRRSARENVLLTPHVFD